MASTDTQNTDLDRYASRGVRGNGARLARLLAGQSGFARGRVQWLRRCLDELGERPSSMLEFGCGSGATVPHFFAELPVRSVIGVEVSRELLAIARGTHTRSEVTWVQLGDYRATESLDLAYTSGVFQRIPPRDRMAAAVLVYRSLASGGLFAFWESNPWSPAARLTTGRASDARRAPALTAPEARRLLRGVGFDIVHTTSAFFFPRALRWCLPLEPMLASIPLGAQYMVLARKP